MNTTELIMNLQKVEFDLKRRCEFSTSDDDGDKWSKRHQIIKDMVIDIVYEDHK